MPDPLANKTIVLSEKSLNRNRLLNFLHRKLSIETHHYFLLAAITVLSGLISFSTFGEGVGGVIGSFDVKGSSQQVWNFDDFSQFSVNTNEAELKNGSILSREVVQLIDNEELFKTGVFENSAWSNEQQSVELSEGLSGSFISPIFAANRPTEWSTVLINGGDTSYNKELEQGLKLSFDFNNSENLGLNQISGSNLSSNGTLSVSDSYSAQSGNAIALNGSIDSSLVSEQLMDFPKSQITNTFWVKTKDKDSGIISYATAGSDNEWVVYRPQSLTLYRGKEQVNTSINIADGEWHFVAITWEGESGEIRVYIDGELRFDKLLAPQSEMGERGILIIGNDQDELGGGLTEEEAFLGELDDLKIWDRKLSGAEIVNIYESSITALTYQVRGCDISCDEVEFIGPDGTSDTFYQISDKLISKLNYSRKFQVKVILSSSIEGYTPTLNSIEVGPKHYINKGILISLQEGIEYRSLSSFTHQVNAKSDGIFYQLSPDNESWYFWNGIDWVLSTEVLDSNEMEVLNDNLDTFATKFGPGNVYFRVILNGDPLDQIGIDSIQLTYDPIKAGSVSGVANSNSRLIAQNIDNTQLKNSDFAITQYQYLEESKELLVRGSVTELHKVILYGPDGEILFTDKVQGNWEFKLPDADKRIGSGVFDLKFIAQNSDGETTAIEQLSIEIPSEISPLFIVSALILIAIISSALIFTILRERKKPSVDEQPQLAIPEEVEEIAEIEIDETSETEKEEPLSEIDIIGDISSTPDMHVPVENEKENWDLETVEDYIRSSTKAEPNMMKSISKLGAVNEPKTEIITAVPPKSTIPTIVLNSEIEVQDSIEKPEPKHALKKVSTNFSPFKPGVRKLS